MCLCMQMLIAMYQWNGATVMRRRSRTRKRCSWEVSAQVITKSTHWFRIGWGINGRPLEDEFRHGVLELDAVHIWRLCLSNRSWPGHTVSNELAIYKRSIECLPKDPRAVWQSSKRLQYMKLATSKRFFENLRGVCTRHHSITAMYRQHNRKVSIKAKENRTKSQPFPSPS